MDQFKNYIYLLAESVSGEEVKLIPWRATQDFDQLLALIWATIPRGSKDAPNT